MIVDAVLFGVACFLCGASLGYFLCRRNLYLIAKDQLTDWQHANLFGYPYKKPTIEELQAILDQEDKS